MQLGCYLAEITSHNLFLAASHEFFNSNLKLLHLLIRHSFTMGEERPTFTVTNGQLPVTLLYCFSLVHQISRIAPCCNVCGRSGNKRCEYSWLPGAVDVLTHKRAAVIGLLGDVLKYLLNSSCTGTDQRLLSFLLSYIYFLHSRRVVSCWRLASVCCQVCCTYVASACT